MAKTSVACVEEHAEKRPTFLEVGKTQVADPDRSLRTKSTRSQKVRRAPSTKDAATNPAVVLSGEGRKLASAVVARRRFVVVHPVVFRQHVALDQLPDGLARALVSFDGDGRSYTAVVRVAGRSREREAGYRREPRVRGPWKSDAGRPRRPSEVGTKGRRDDGGIRTSTWPHEGRNLGSKSAREGAC